MLDKQEYYLNIAKAVARKSTCLKRQYGAIIVKNDEIIATGYNGPPRGLPHCTKCNRLNKASNGSDYSDCNSVHAEMNAIIQAPRRDMIDSTLYLAGYENDVEIENPTPCLICGRLITNAGITTVINNKTQKIQAL